MRPAVARLWIGGMLRRPPETVLLLSDDHGQKSPRRAHGCAPRKRPPYLSARHVAGADRQLRADRPDLTLGLFGVGEPDRHYIAGRVPPALDRSRPGTEAHWMVPPYVSEGSGERCHPGRRPARGRRGWVIEIAR